MAGVAVGEDQDGDAEPDGGRRLGAEPLHRLLHPRRALRHRPGAVEGLGVEDVMVDIAQLVQLVVAEDGLGHDQLVGVVG